MSQHDYVLENANGATYRADGNALFDAMATLNSGATAPTTTFANMWWADTSTNILKRRNNANTAWIEYSSLTVGITALLADLSGVTDAPTARDNLGLGTGDAPTFDGLSISGTVQLSPGIGRTDAHGAAYIYQNPITGKDDGANAHTYARSDYFVSSDADGSEAGQHIFNNSIAGSLTEIFRFGGGLYYNSAAGGDKGVGTINFSAVYDDNVLLTCYVFDQALDGDIVNAKWDGLAPNTTDKPARTHDDMRKFKSRIGSQYDPMNIDKYAQHWKDKRHLTALPNEVTFDPVKGMPTGAWIQRLVETVEVQAIHIEGLNQRLKVLEAKAAP